MDSSLIITAITLLSITLTLIYYYLSSSRKRKPHSSSEKVPPPEADGAWPIIGHLPLLGGSEPPHETLARLAEKHGPIFTLRMGVHRAVIVTGSEIARECFTTNDKVFANRPEAVAAVEHMAYNYAMFGFSPYGSYWRRVRRIATLELLSNHRSLWRLGNVGEFEVNKAVEEIVKCGDGSVRVEMRKWFGDVTLNTVFKIVVGKRYSGGDRYLKAISDFFELSGTFVVGDAIPWLRWFDFGGYEKAMKNTFKELDQVLQGWLEEHKRNRELLKDSDDQDFMGSLLSILGDAQDMSGYDADTINKATCLAFILAGTDSTAVTMTWALALLLNNPDSLKKAQQELDRIVGPDRKVRESDTKSLPYLQAILKETLRLYPALPLLAPHYSSQDCTVGGFHVAKGTRLLVNVSEIQRDPDFWSNPTEFRPERFLTTQRDVDVKGGQDYKFMPFGSGRRMCPGISFSLQLMSLTLASLLHGFDFETESDDPVDMRGTTGLAYAKASPLNVLLKPRLAHI